MQKHISLVLWRMLAITSVLLGLIGIPLPGLPTVPFMLLAAWAASHGWPALEHWLVHHRTHGPTIQAWREHGAVPLRAKWLATGMMTCSSLVLLAMPWSGWVKLCLIGPMLCVLPWLWRRPDTGEYGA